MAKKKEKTKKKVPVKLAVSEKSQIICTGCPVPKELTASPSNVYIKGKPVTTAKDIDLELNIKPFDTCSLNPLKKCVFNSCSLWDAKIENVTAVNHKPLTVEDKLECAAMGGQISFFFPGPEQPSVPKNPIDSIQSKINTKINDVTKKAAELAKKAGESISAIGDTIKKAGAFTKNAGFQNAVDTASDLVDEIDYQKARLDTGVGNVDIKIKNLKLQIKQLLTGEQQKFLDEMEVVREEDQEKGTANTTNEEKDFGLNQEIFNAETRKAVNEFLKYLNTAGLTVDPTNPKSFIVKEKDISNKEESVQEQNQKPSGGNRSNPISEEDKSIIALPSIITSVTNISDDYSNRANDGYNSYTKDIKSHNSDIALEGANDSKEALRILYLLGNLTNDQRPEININQSSLTPRIHIPGINEIDDIIKNTAIGIAALEVSETRTELNDKVQAKINERLKELEYFEKLSKYQKESADVQKDIDKAAAALDLIGDFDAFVDGIIGEEFGKISIKVKDKLSKLNKNMGRLNTGLNAASFVASGFAKGDVYTHVEIEEEAPDDENENDSSRTAAANIDTSALFDDNSAITDDRNEEAKILRMFVIWDQDYEDFKEGELVTVETIPPDTQVCLVIQANKKADGKVVSVDLGDRSLHYEYDGGHQCRVTREGLFEDIILNGDSPDFENEGQYDLNDPDYAIEGGNRRQLSDTTKIKLVSVLPPEEEEESVI